MHERVVEKSLCSILLCRGSERAPRGAACFQGCRELPLSRVAREAGNAAGLVRSRVPLQPVARACLCRQDQSLIITKVNIPMEGLTALIQNSSRRVV